MKLYLFSWTVRIGFGMVLAAVLSSSVVALQSTPVSANNHTIYVPLVQYRSPLQTVFGLEMAAVTPERGLDLVITSGTKWVRRNALRWKDIEPVEGQGYSWDAPHIKSLEQEMINASQNNLNLILVVRGSPQWATTPYSADCAPIHPDKYASFARFMAAAVARYSQPPYNVRYWEMGNEPDAHIFPEDSVYGCWGVTSDPYYGGEAYGNMLKVVAPAMKAANPQIKILNGGLLLDKPYDPQDSSSVSGRFIEGVLRAGAGDTFDILSFHSYTYYGSPGAPLLGPKEDWRIAYLQDLMRQYNVAAKPMLRTEAALLCVQITTECRWAQADYIGRLYARSLRDQVLGNIWYVYDADSYHSTALIEPGDVFVPRPAYYAFRHAAQMLSGVDYLGPLEGVPAAIEGYRFGAGADTIIIVWTDSPQRVVIPVAAGATVSCTDRAGGTIACSNANGGVQLSVEASPIYLRVR